MCKVFEFLPGSLNMNIFMLKFFFCFAEWLTENGSLIRSSCPNVFCKKKVLGESLSDVLTTAYIRHTASRIYTCTEPEFRLFWVKLCKSDKDKNIQKGVVDLYWITNICWMNICCFKHFMWETLKWTSPWSLRTQDFLFQFTMLALFSNLSSKFLK